MLTGHANTALYLALSYLRQVRGPGQVVVPPIVCPTVVQTVIYAGFEPVFVDVTLPVCTIAPEAAAAAITGKTRAILAVHIFGYSAEMATLSELAKRHDIWLIEDAAQSIGGNVDGRAHGGWGEVSLYSFGGTKIIKAGGGGALLCDHDDLASYVSAAAAQFPPLDVDLDFKLLSLSHRNLIHGMMDALRVAPDAPVGDSLRSLINIYKPLCLHAFNLQSNLTALISQGLDDLPRNLTARRERGARYYAGFSDLAAAVHLPPRSVCDQTIWRFTLLVDDPQRLKRLTARLRNAGLNASNHYWSAAQLLGDNASLPNAAFASPRLLNLWVDAEIELDEVQRTVDTLQAELRG